MSQEERDLWGFAGANRAKLDAMAAELERVRDKVHRLEGEAAAIRYLAEKIEQMAERVERLADRVERLAQRTVARPSASAWNAIGGWAAVVVAVVALVVAVKR